MTESNCIICLDVGKVPLIAPCCGSHYCSRCISIWLGSGKSSCPCCRDYLSMRRIYNEKGNHESLLAYFNTSKLSQRRKHRIYQRCPTFSVQFNDLESNGNYYHPRNLFVPSYLRMPRFDLLVQKIYSLADVVVPGDPWDYLVASGYSWADVKMLKDLLGKVVVRGYSLGDLVMLKHFLADVMVPRDLSADVIVPKDPWADVVVPGDPSADVVVPGDPSADVVVPRDSSADVVVPRYPWADVVVPGDPSADVVVPRDPWADVVVPRNPWADVIQQQKRTYCLHRVALPRYPLPVQSINSLPDVVMPGDPSVGVAVPRADVIQQENRVSRHRNPSVEWIPQLNQEMGEPRDLLANYPSPSDVHGVSLNELPGYDGDESEYLLELNLANFDIGSIVDDEN